MSGWLGIFDSGVGGLTVARAVARTLAAEDIAYLGDTARVPYGTRSPDTVRRYAAGNVQFLAELGLKALVVACNTASAVALDDVGERFTGPVLGVVDPGAVAAAQRTQTGCVAVLGTATTIASGAYVDAIANCDPSIDVVSLACPLFVPLAEEGWVSGAVPTAVAKRYLAPLASTEVDTLVLGCTHYPLLRPVIEEVASQLTGRRIEVLDSADAVATELAARLSEQGLARPAGPPGRRRFFVTDALESFRHVAPRFLGSPLADVELVDVRPV